MPDIDHVVVFENRSFDHMLGGALRRPGVPGVRAGDDGYSNPVDPRNRSKGRVRVTDDAAVGLPVDPPHEHASVIEQLGRRGRRAPAMDGFVAAYSRKIADREEGSM